MNKVRFFFFLLPFPLFGCGDPDPFPILNPPAVFSFPTNLSKTTASGCPQAPPGCSITPDLAMDGSGNVHAVWAEDGEIFFVRLTDAGTTFSPGRNISGTMELSATPAVAVDGSGNINIIWEEDYRVVFTRSTDGGNSFSTLQSLFADPAGISESLAFAVDGTGNINVVWEEDWDIRFARFSVNADGTLNFSISAKNLSNTFNNGTTGFSSAPRIAADPSGGIHVIWEEDFVAAYTRSSVGGAAFSAVRMISDPAGFSGGMDIAIGGTGTIHIVYEQDWEIYSVRSADGGTGFSTAQNLSNTLLVNNASGFSATPAVAVDGSGRINVVWEEDFRIVFRRSLTGGADFSAVQDLSIASAVSTLPALAVDGSGAIHAVWQDDDLAGNTEIFFVKGE